MPAIQTTTDIAAAPAAVWEALSDLAGYPRWNPFTYCAQGELKLHASLLLSVCFPNGSEVRAGLAGYLAVRPAHPRRV